MKNWPPSSPASDLFIGAFHSLKENIRTELHQREMSAADRSLARYMRSLNVGTRLLRETEGPYTKEFVVAFETITDRNIRSKLLHVFRVSPDEDGVFVVPTDVTHKAANGVSKKEAAVLADELVGGFYEQYEIANMIGISNKELRNISPERYEEQLREIYELIRQRALRVLED